MSYANWNAIADYLTNDIVYEGSTAYVALANNTNTLPSANPLVWDPVSPGGGGLTNVVTANGSGIVSVVAGATATLSSALVNDPNITLTPAVPPSKDLTIGLQSRLTSITEINGTSTSAYGWEDFADPITSQPITTQTFVTANPIISLAFVNDGSPSCVVPTNQLLWYEITGANTFTINLSAPAGIGSKLVVAWNLLKA